MIDVPLAHRSIGADEVSVASESRDGDVVLTMGAGSIGAAAADNQDWPKHFRLAKAMRKSSVEYRHCNIYDMSPYNVGTFDLVFCGSVLIHLRDQLLALERIAGLVREGGTFVSAEAYYTRAGRLPLAIARYRADRPKDVVFWEPNPRAWRRMLWTAGFDEVREHGRFKLEARAGWAVPHVVHHARR